MATFEDYGIDTKGRSGNVKTACPKCSHTRKNPKNPCLSVDTDKKVWKCHHCSFSGGLGDGLGVERERKPYKRPVFTPSPMVHPQLVEYFNKRGIMAKTVESAKIKLATKYFHEAGGEIPAIQFPYFRKEWCVNVKSRALDRKAFMQEAGAEKVLYGLDGIADVDWAVVVEGEIDALSFWQAGITNCVSVPDGAPPAGSKPSDVKFEYIPNCEKELAHLTKIIIAVDSDGPGQTLEEELARRLGPERCYRIQWPEGIKDANEFLLARGAEALAAYLESAQPWPIAGMVEVRDIVDEIEALFLGGDGRGVSTGILPLDQFYSVQVGEMTIVTGIPGHGKSELLDALMVNVAERHGWKFGVCSPENFPLAEHAAKLIEKYIGLPFRVGPTARMEWRQLVDGMQWLQEWFVFFNPPEDELSIDAVMAIARKVVSRYGIRGMVIDPWNEFEHSMDRNQTETNYIGETLTKIRRFGRNHGVHMWVVAHPAKLKKREDGTYPVPTPYDISGSANWRNKADNCLTVYRDLEGEDDRAVQVHIQKIKFRRTGRVGMAELSWNPVNGRYS